MKLNQFKTSPTTSSGNMVVSKMGVAANSGDMLTMFLRDKIYSDKELACIRETITNAMDEHVKHKINKTVEVKIERQGDSYVWTCRDFALGLPDEKIRTVYGMYGGSDKRDNDEQAGGFGIGALSPFAVTDTFYVISHHNGVKTTYACILGAGDSGIPTGEIFEITKEDTTESGIEVQVPDLTRTQAELFDIKTKRFIASVRVGADIRYTDSNKQEHFPHTPLFTEVVNGYTFHAYKKQSINIYSKYDNGNGQAFGVRMGDVIYKWYSLPHNTPVSRHDIVVDLPINTLTIPISRESIETTDRNNAIITDVSIAIQALVKQQEATISVPKFGECFLTNNSSFNKMYETDWFSYDFWRLFPGSKTFKNSLTHVHDYDQEKRANSDGSHNIYVMPNIKNINGWITRLKMHFVNNKINRGFYYVYHNQYVDGVLNGSYNKNELDLSDINFIVVKEMKYLPKLPKKPKNKDAKKYAVYLNGRKKGDFTADSLEELINPDGEEIEENWHETVESISDLRIRTIGLASVWGKNNNFYVTYSAELYKDLLELGWINPESDAYKNAKKRIEQKEEAERGMRSRMQEANNMFKIELNKIALKRIGKTDKGVDRVKKVKEKILCEKSTRSRILKAIISGYYSHGVTRDDLRKIMNIK